MPTILKIKKNKTIYTIKIKIRNLKNFIKGFIFLFINGSGLKRIIIFTKNFIKKKIHFDRSKFYKEKNFNHGDWFTHKAPLLVNYFDNKNKNKNEIIEILEIGSWEGRSSCFFLNYFEKSVLTCVDTWEGSDENFYNDYPDLNKVESNFDKNVFEFKNRVTKYKLKSKAFFNSNKKMFDFIYIDGSHFYDDVLNDANDGFNVLKRNSYILFDDYNWNFYKHGKNPINAINLFLNLNKEKIKIIYISAQVLIQKMN